MTYNLYGENDFDKTQDSKVEEFKRGQRVCKLGGDYTFDGRVVATFHKLGNPAAVRVVVEDSRGLLLIMNPKQLQDVSIPNARSDGG